MLIEGEQNLLKHATEYYQELFGPETEYDVHIDPTLWSSVENLCEHDNTNLFQPFSETEIKEALFLMERNKAPSPDNRVLSKLLGDCQG